MLRSRERAGEPFPLAVLVVTTVVLIAARPFVDSSILEAALWLATVGVTAVLLLGLTVVLVKLLGLGARAAASVLATGGVSLLREDPVERTAVKSRAADRNPTSLRAIISTGGASLLRDPSVRPRDDS
jgi:hypothetical protein